jgi:hypothetical protein
MANKLYGLLTYGISVDDDLSRSHLGAWEDGNVGLIRVKYEAVDIAYEMPKCLGKCTNTNSLASYQSPSV